VREVLSFDVACRVKEAAGALRSTYVTTELAAETRNALALGKSVRLLCSPGCLPAVSSHRVQLGPSGSIDASPATVRWRYEIRCLLLDDAAG
jgi:hypothetical protein